MGLFNFIFKKKSKVLKFEVAKIDWTYDTVCEEYCIQNNKEADELTEKEEDLIMDYAGNYIAFFLAWLIKNDFLSAAYDYLKKDLTAVKSEKMTGINFLQKHFDGKLCRDDMSNEILGFVDSYFDNKYIDDYINFMENDLKKVGFLHPFSWEEFNEFRSVLDSAYASYKEELINKEKEEVK